jgi:hypothetical protein
VFKGDDDHQGGYVELVSIAASGDEGKLFVAEGTQTRVRIPVTFQMLEIHKHQDPIHARLSEEFHVSPSESLVLVAQMTTNS